MPTLDAVARQVTIDLDREECPKRLSTFVKAAWPVVWPSFPLRWNWHMDAICDHMQAFMAGQIPFLVINVPPRSSKSTIATICSTPWSWAHNPGTTWLFGSYNHRLALDHSRRARLLIMSQWYQDRWGDVFRLAVDQNMKQRFDNNRGGHRIAGGLGGVTGVGGRYLVVDDPHDIEDRHNENEIARRVSSFRDEFSGRSDAPQTPHIAIIAQRVRDNDVSGTAIRDFGYEAIVIPQRYVPTTYVSAIGWRDPRTEPDQPLDARRFPKPFITMEKKKGSDYFSAIHQQNPSPPGGSIIKVYWLRFWRDIGTNADDFPPVKVRKEDGTLHKCPVIEVPSKYDKELKEAVWDFDIQMQSWDMTFKDTGTSEVCGQVWGRKGADKFLLDQVLDHMDFPQTKVELKQLSLEYPEANVKLIEEAANGPAIVADLKHQVSGLIARRAVGSKVARLSAQSYQLESGNVYLPHPEMYPWVQQLVHRLTRFPDADKDDEVDALSQALKRMSSRHQPRIDQL